MVRTPGGPALAGVLLAFLAARPVPASDATLELVVDGLDFPAGAVALNDGRDRLYIPEHYSGRIVVVEDGALRPTPFLDIADRIVAGAEEGLLGLAFPPGFPQARHVYVSYTGRNRDLVLSRFAVTEDAGAADPASEEVILSTERWSRVHHCGTLRFGPDGHLYYCIGDSDEQGNPRDTAQDLGMLQGKILRIDVEHAGAAPYAIPADNPLVGHAGARPEIFAYGLRNAWQFSFDPVAGALIIPDVGMAHWEEINILVDGRGTRNFGWSRAEGNECLTNECKIDELDWPILEYAHLSEHCAVIGGSTYVGADFPQWHGVYVFGDFCSASIWALRDPLGSPSIRLLLAGEVIPSAIDTDHRGEILVVAGFGDSIYRLRFPEDTTDGWQPVELFMHEQVTRARRMGETAALEFRSGRLWRWFDWARGWYQWLGKPFG